MAGIRDRLIYDDFGVDYDIAWDVATRRIPDLDAKIRVLLRTIEESEE